MLADCDLERAVELAHHAIFFNMGQCCAAGSRTYVQQEVYDEFVRKSVMRAKTRVVGDPFGQGVEHGPQVSQLQYQTVMKYIEIGKQQGAKLECGGVRCGESGYFVMPTVFSGVTDDMTIASEEIFGPVQCIIKFNTIEEVVERANNSDYGLAAGVHTSSLDSAMKISSQLRAGTVWVNAYDVFDVSARTCMHTHDSLPSLHTRGRSLYSLPLLP